MEIGKLKSGSIRLTEWLKTVMETWEGKLKLNHLMEYKEEKEIQYLEGCQIEANSWNMKNKN